MRCSCLRANRRCSSSKVHISFPINNGHCQPSDSSSAFRCQKAAWGQVEVFRCNLSEPQGFCRISPVEEYEHVVCRLVVELWPRIGVDVVHHPVACVLSEFNVCPLLEYPSFGPVAIKNIQGHLTPLKLADRSSFCFIFAVCSRIRDSLLQICIQ